MGCVSLSMDLFVLCVVCLTVFVNCMMSKLYNITNFRSDSGTNRILSFYIIGITEPVLSKSNSNKYVMTGVSQL